MTDIITGIEAELARLRSRIEMLETDRIRLLRSNEQLREELNFDAGQRAADQLRVELNEERLKILGTKEQVFLAEIEKMREAEPMLSMRELFALWKEHNAESLAEARAKEAANAGGEALRSWLGSWMMAGAPQDKGLCGCGSLDCSDRDRVFVRGRGFVDRYALEQEAGGAAEVPDPAPAKKTWAQVVGRK